MSTIFTARCAQGKLIVTETHIILERPGTSQTMARSAFTGLDMQLSMWLPGASAYRLIFHGQGAERLKAGMVKGKDAKQVRLLLTGR